MIGLETMTGEQAPSTVSARYTIINQHSSEWWSAIIKWILVH